MEMTARVCDEIDTVRRRSPPSLCIFVSLASRIFADLGIATNRRDCDCVFDIYKLRHDDRRFPSREDREDGRATSPSSSSSLFTRVSCRVEIRALNQIIITVPR